MNVEMIKVLEDYALANYEEGGHWVYETFSKADYQGVLDMCLGNLDEAKEAVRGYWVRMNERERECAWE